MAHAIGEFVLTYENYLDWIEFGIAALFGFLPLIIVHFAIRHPRVALDQLQTRWSPIIWGQAYWRLSAIKTSLLIFLADWWGHLVI